MVRLILGICCAAFFIAPAFACEKTTDKVSRFLLEADLEESTYLKCGFVRLLLKNEAADKSTFLKKLEVEIFDDEGARLLRFPPALEQPAPGFSQAEFCVQSAQVERATVRVYAEHLTAVALSKQRTHVGKGEGCYDLEVYPLKLLLKEYPVSVVENPVADH